MNLKNISLNWKIKLLLCLLNIFILSYNQRIYINSIPKCGTHLLAKCIELLTNKTIINTQKDVVTTNNMPKLDEDSILLWHLWHSKKAEDELKKNKFKGLFIYRDPRDKVISSAFWCLKHTHLLTDLLGYKNINVDFNDIIMSLILRVNKVYSLFLDWIKVPYFYSIKFEDLVGINGGGNYLTQYNEIRKICQFIGKDGKHEKIEKCISNLYGNTNTFREGKIGSWKKYFNQKHIELFKKEAGKLLIELGYEKDLNW